MLSKGDRRGRHGTRAISAYHHLSCEFEPRPWLGVYHTTLCDKVCLCPATGRWFSPVTRISSSNKTYQHDITEILLKVSLNTINQTLKKNMSILKIIIHCI